MSFATTTKTKILKYQAYIINADNITSSTLNQLIDQQMQSVEDSNPDLIPVIEADLTTLDSLDTLLTTEEGSANSALIQADVLRWAEGQKTSGIKTRFESIRARIARMLSQSIAAQPISNGWGSGTLDRG